MYSVFVVSCVQILNYDVGERIYAVCETRQAAERWIKAEKARFQQKTGVEWDEDIYAEGRLRIAEHYLHVNGERP